MITKQDIIILQAKGAKFRALLKAEKRTLTDFWLHEVYEQCNYISYPHFSNVIRGVQGNGRVNSKGAYSTGRTDVWKIIDDYLEVNDD